MSIVQFSLLLTNLFELVIAIMSNFGRNFFSSTTIREF